MSVRTAWLLGVAALGAQPLAAQNLWPEWTTAWSALQPISVDVRRLPLGTALAERGLGLAPRVGLLWFAGNPAGLARDVNDSRAWLELARDEQGGAYRRPLDPDAVSTWTLGGLGWRPLGRGAVAGRIAFDNRRADVATASDALLPYGADPFVVVDTTSPGRRSVHAALEGAAGWRFGPWHAGLSLGVEMHRDRSVDARFSRVGRSSGTGAMLGVGRQIQPLGLQVAVHGRWLGRRESHLLATDPDGSVVYILSGFFDRDPIDVAPPSGFFRRSTADGFAGGAAAAWRSGSIGWFVFFERGGWDAEHVNTVALDDPPADRWEATVTRAGLAARVSLTGTIDLQVRASHRSLSGDARRSDLNGVVFRASDARLTLDGAVELVDPASPWQASLTIRGERLRMDREDFLAEVPLDVTAWLSEAAVAVGRHFGSVSAGVVVGVGLYAPAAAIPDPSTLGPVYGTYLAREQSLYAVGAFPLSAGFWLRHRFSGSVTGYLQGGAERTAGRGSMPDIPALPEGQKYRGRIALGIELTPQE